MAELVTLVEQHMEREQPTFAIQATTEWEAVLALVYLQEGGLGVYLHVYVRCYYLATWHACACQGASKPKIHKITVLETMYKWMFKIV